jgi:hypothetical protein
MPAVVEMDVTSVFALSNAALVLFKTSWPLTITLCESIFALSVDITKVGSAMFKRLFSCMCGT